MVLLKLILRLWTGTRSPGSCIPDRPKPRTRTRVHSERAEAPESVAWAENAPAPRSARPAAPGQPASFLNRNTRVPSPRVPERWAFQGGLKRDNVGVSSLVVNGPAGGEEGDTRFSPPDPDQS